METTIYPITPVVHHLKNKTSYSPSATMLSSLSKETILSIGVVIYTSRTTQPQTMIHTGSVMSVLHPKLTPQPTLGSLRHVFEEFALVCHPDSQREQSEGAGLVGGCHWGRHVQKQGGDAKRQLQQAGTGVSRHDSGHRSYTGPRAMNDEMLSVSCGETDGHRDH